MLEAVDDVHGFDALRKRNALSLSDTTTGAAVACFSHAAANNTGSHAAERKGIESIAKESAGDAIVETSVDDGTRAEFSGFTDSLGVDDKQVACSARVCFSSRFGHDILFLFVFVRLSYAFVARAFS